MTHVSPQLSRSAADDERGSQAALATGQPGGPVPSLNHQNDSLPPPPPVTRSV